MGAWLQACCATAGDGRRLSEQSLLDEAGELDPLASFRAAVDRNNAAFFALRPDVKRQFDVARARRANATSPQVTSV